MRWPTILPSVPRGRSETADVCAVRCPGGWSWMMPPRSPTCSRAIDGLQRRRERAIASPVQPRAQILRPDAQRLASGFVRAVTATGRPSWLTISATWAAAESCWDGCDPLTGPHHPAGGPMAERFHAGRLIRASLAPGKTTLLQLVGRARACDTAVLINEFGEVGLDHHLLERLATPWCCTVGLPLLHDRGELSVAIGSCIQSASGWCRLFAGWWSRHRHSRPLHPIDGAGRPRAPSFPPGNVITVDAVNGWPSSRASRGTKQVAVADHGADQDRPRRRAVTRALIGRLRQLNPSAPLWRAGAGDAGHCCAHTCSRRRPQQARGAGSRRNTPWAWHRARPQPAWRTIHAFLCFDGPIDWTLFGLW